MHDDPNRNSAESLAPTEIDVPEISRRAALEKLGKLAGYTAPVMLTLLVTRKARAVSEDPPNPPP